MTLILTGSRWNDDQNDKIDKSLRLVKMNVKYSFEKLEIWQLGLVIARMVYKLTKNFPRDELWGLTSQLRRSGASIPMNIAEGSARRSKKDFSLFLRRALGSLLELVTAADIAHGEKYLEGKEEEYEYLKSLCQEEYFKIIAFEKALLR